MLNLSQTMSEFDFDQLVIRKLINKQQNAKHRGLEFNMTHAIMRDLLIATHCFYTGLPLTENVHGEGWKATDRTIERVDNEKGYIKGNVVAVCWAANQAKSVFENAAKSSGLDLRQAVNMFENIGTWLRAADKEV